MQKTVLLTGVTGFIAGHIAVELLRRGYRVRGSLRSLVRVGPLTQLFTALGFSEDSFEFVELDLERDAGWAEAMDGCCAIQHVASPFPIDDPSDKMAMVPAARGGTLRILSQARRAGVPKVVLTSSTAAIKDGVRKPDEYVFSESDWSDTASEHIRAYSMSKTLAEAAAWADVEEHGGPVLTVMNPSFVLGPMLDQTLSTSGEVVRLMFTGKYPAVPELCFAVVDVRDVARAHVNGMEMPEADGQRFLLSSGTMMMIDMAKVLKSRFPASSSKLPRFQAPGLMVKILSLFDPSVRGVLPEIGKRYGINNEKASKVLGIEFAKTEDALVAMGESLISRNMI